jgi:hypothetical protein
MQQLKLKLKKLASEQRLLRFLPKLRSLSKSTDKIAQTIQIVMKKFVKKHGKDGWDFTNANNFKLAKNVAIERKGLVFMYNSYEIGPYAAGAPEVLITWEELKDLRKENPYITFD